MGSRNNFEVTWLDESDQSGVFWNKTADSNLYNDASRLRGSPVARAIVVALEGPRVGIYCPHCKRGGLRDKILTGLLSEQDEFCPCGERYELPNFRALAMNPEGLRELATKALNLAAELEKTAPS